MVPSIPKSQINDNMYIIIQVKNRNSFYHSLPCICTVIEHADSTNPSTLYQNVIIKLISISEQVITYTNLKDKQYFKSRTVTINNATILQWIIMGSLTYACFVPERLITDLCANSSNISFEVPLASK